MPRHEKVNGVTVYAITPRTRLARLSLIKAIGDRQEEFEKELDLSREIFEIAFWEFASLCSRVLDENQSLGFELAGPRDTDEEIFTKFRDYLNSDQVSVIDELSLAMARLDKPFDKATAPVLLEEESDPNLGKDGKSGKRASKKK